MDGLNSENTDLKEAVKDEKVKDKEIKEELKDDKKESGYNWKWLI